VNGGIQQPQAKVTTARHHGALLAFLLGLMDQGDQGVVREHPPGDGAFLLIQHDAEQPDKHPPGSACSDSDASCRFGLGIR